MLGDEPTEPGCQPQSGAPATLAQEVAQGGDAVGRVVVARAAEVGEAPGHGQAPGVVECDAEGVGPHLHGGREARVEVQALEIVDIDGASGRSRGRVEQGRAGRPDGRRPAGVGSGGDEADVDGLGARPHEHGPVLDAGPARLGQRADDQCGCLVRAEECRHALRIGLAHDPVVRCGGGDLLGGADLGEPCVGIGRGDLGERRHQPADGGPVRVGVTPGPGREDVLEQRVDVHRSEQ